MLKSLIFSFVQLVFLQRFPGIPGTKNTNKNRGGGGRYRKSDRDRDRETESERDAETDRQTSNNL